jgi:Tfp pilus assembly PilM family ATPase
MPERILGLDIGVDAVKAVLLSRGFRGGYRVLAVRRIDAGEAGGVPEALQELFADQSFRGAVCVTALPAGALSFRNIRLPFRDDRKIRQTLAFALEPVIQTSLDEVFIDYTLAGHAKQAEIFVALAPRALVGERTALLKEYVRETAVIDIDAVPLALRLTEKPGIQGSTLLLDVGARDTAAVFSGGGRILHIRHFPFGGEVVTRTMTETTGNGLSETEALKRSGDIPPEAWTAIRECSGRFLGELRNTQAYLLWQGSLAQAPARILMTGGGSRTPGLAEGLAELFAVPVERADLAAAVGIEIDEVFRESWDTAVMDQALALAARPMAKGGGFNFRQRASEARADYGELRNRLKKGAYVALVILTLAGIEFGLDDYSARLRLAALKQDIQTEFRKIYPEATRIVDPVAQLRGKIAESRKISAGMVDATSAVTALDLLREISMLAPSDLLVTSFNLDGNAVGMKGQTRNFDAVESIKKTFANSKYFKTVTIDSTNLIKQGNGVEFDMKIILKK